MQPKPVLRPCWVFWLFRWRSRRRVRRRPTRCSFPSRWASSSAVPNAPMGQLGVDPARDHCVLQAGAVQVKGLGTVHVTTLHVVILSNASCPHGSVTGELKTARGTLEVSGTAPGCVNSTFGYADYPIAITGSGGLSGVSGSGTIANQGAYVVTATLSAPSSLFDVESPVITGAVNKTVKTSSRLGARVRFAVTARDGVDGRVGVNCHPPSGTRFRVGQRASPARRPTRAPTP